MASKSGSPRPPSFSLDHSSERTTAAAAAASESLVASLVDSETNPHPLDTQSHAQELIHSKVEQPRFRIIDALWNSGDEAMVKRAQRMGLCCVSPQICVGEGKAPACIAGHCRDRMCPTCMRRRGHRVRVRINGLVQTMNSPRFLTLTAKDDGRSLKARTDELWNGFQKLRRTKVWKAHVRGGVMVGETKKNVARDSWHPHLHIIIDGTFFPHGLLHAEWKRIIGRDCTADLRACPDRAAAARYISAYVTKENDLTRWMPHDIIEFATAMHRRRLVATFGTAHAINVDLCDAEPELPPIPRTIISYAALRAAILQQVPAALAAAPILARVSGAWRQLFFEFATMGGGELEQVTTAELDELARWIEELDAPAFRCAEEPPQPPPDTYTSRLF